MQLDSGDLKEIGKLVAAANQRSELPYRLGNQLVSRQTNYTSGGSGNQIVAANPNRVVLGFASGSGSIIVGTTLPTPMSFFWPGIVVSNQFAAVWLNVNEHGTLPQLAWFQQDTGTSVFVAVFEVIWHPPGG